MSDTSSMNSPVSFESHSAPEYAKYFFGRPKSEHGVVLVLALLVLVVISLLAVTSLRNAGSVEGVVGNLRVTELATQAAEIALRHCEASVLADMTVAAGGNASYQTTLDDSYILPSGTPPNWQNTALWDGDSTAVFVLPLMLLNQPGMTRSTYKRAPECMVERLPPGAAGGGGGAATFYLITVRGFGPEVAALAGKTRLRPLGSEIWLQSNIKVEFE